MFSVKSLFRSGRVLDWPNLMILMVLEWGISKSKIRSQPLDVGDTIRILTGGFTSNTIFSFISITLSVREALG